jgi:hypothetical protein
LRKNAGEAAGERTRAKRDEDEKEPWEGERDEIALRLMRERAKEPLAFTFN